MPVIREVYTVLTEAEFEGLKCGDRVRVVPYWNSQSKQNPSGHMDKYLNSIVTIDELPAIGWTGIVEDKDDPFRRWKWNRYCFCEIIQVKEYEPATDKELYLLFHNLI